MKINKKVIIRTALLCVIICLLLVVYVQCKTAVHVASIEPICNNCSNYSVSSDGNTVAAISKNRILIIDIKGRKQEELPVRLSDHEEIIELSLSPDGEYLAFTKYSSVKKITNLYIASRSTKKIKPVDSASKLYSMSWSPDGRSLAWIRTSNIYYPNFEKSFYPLQICIQKIAKAPSINVIYEGKPKGRYFQNISLLRWLPYGSHIAFECGDIFFIRPDGKDQWLIAAPPRKYPNEYIRGWDISHDGKKLAFGFGEYIWISEVTKNAAPKQSITKIPFALCWSPDAESMLFSIYDKSIRKPIAPGDSPANYPTNIYWVSADGKRQQLVYQGKNIIKNLSWSKQSEMLFISDGKLWLAKLN